MHINTKSNTINKKLTLTSTNSDYIITIIRLWKARANNSVFNHKSQQIKNYFDRSSVIKFWENLFANLRRESCAFS